MSERKITSTTIRDSEDKLGLTPEGVNQLLAENNTTVAKTKGFTQIGDANFEDGLIFTSLMKLLDAGNEGQEMAGISGIAGDNKEDPAFWAGGSYDQAIGGTAKTIIRHDGSSKFTDTEITGKIESNIDGNRIIIDPQKRELRMINQVGRPVLIADFNVDPSNPVNNFSQIRLNRHNADGVIIQQINITPSKIGIEFDDPDLSLRGSASFGAYYMGMVMQEENTHNNLYTTKASFNASYDGANGNLSLTTTGLPTSSAGLSTGRIYSDNGTIKVKT